MLLETAKLREIREQASKELASRRLYFFARQGFKRVDPARFSDGPHIEAICNALQAVSEGHIRRLLINVPFRSMKSTITSVLWPAWDWIEHPERKFFTLSHAEKLAIRDARKHRLIVEDTRWYGKHWPIELAPDQNEKKRFINLSQGERICAGLDAGVTGEGGDIIVIDDPADRDKAQSPTERQNLIETVTEKVFTRINDAATGAIVIIGQRLAPGDLFGHLLEIGGWEHLCIPMRFEPDHPHLSKLSSGWKDWRTEPGQLMWPEKLPEVTVAALEREIGSFATAGQLQQRPHVRGGVMFNRSWFPDVDDVPADCKVFVRYWDKAGTEDSRSDWSAGVLVAYHNGIFYVVHVVRGKWNPTARNLVMHQTAVADKEKYGDKVRVWGETEPGSSGKESSLISTRELAEFGARFEPVTGDKVVRAANVVPQAEIGNYRMVRGAWNRDFLDEVCAFPLGDHDDQVDGLSGAHAKITTRKKWLIA